MRRCIVFIVFLIALFTATEAFAENPQITNGLNYLAATQSTEGYWMSGDETILTTEEAMKTLALLNQTGTAGYTLASSWLQNQSLEATNHVAGRIYILAAPGTDRNLLISYLDELVRAWGGHDDFGVNNLDTALALQALKKINYADQTVIQTAIGYLLSNQNTDGGWGFYHDDVSNVYMTANILITLGQFKAIYNLQDSITISVAYLLGKQNTDGGFGSSPSTVYDSALALTALVESGVRFPDVAQPAINYIAALQSADGSWEEDPYLTALALRAFAYFKPDIVITPSDITFSKSDPITGDTIDIYANIRNDGPETAANISVKFYYCDPDDGGTLIGESVIPSIAAFSSAPAQIAWTVPLAAACGVYVVVSQVNPNEELNNSNNKAFKNLTSATLPDLSISSGDISFLPASPRAGESVIITTYVRNSGETPASGFSVDLYDGDPNSGGMAIGNAAIPSLGAGASVSITLSDSFTGGDHIIFVVIDKENSLAEGNKTNNAASKTLTVSGENPDPSISGSDITFSPASPKAGDPVTINAIVRNSGEGTANNVEVAFYLNDPQSGGVKIGSSVNIPALSGRGNANVSIPWDSTGYAGKNDIYVLIDPQDLIAETSEVNNQAFQTIVILDESGADLSISAGDIHITPAQPNAGEQAAVSVTVYNGGTQDAVNVPVEMCLGDPRLGGTLVFDTQTMSAIPQGGSAVVQATFNTTGYAGAYEIYVNVDPFNTIVETNKTNNLAHATIAIKAASAPDLMVAQIDTTASTTDGQTLTLSGTVTATIKNRGSIDATAPFEITVFEDADKNGKFDPAIDKVFGKTTYSDNLAAGDSDTANINVSGTVLFKDNLLYVMADSANALTELDETNNIYHSGQQCAAAPQVGTFNPVEKWRWTGGTTMPTYRTVLMTPMVARIADTNNDNVIDENDVPAIIFSSRNSSDGILRAIRGDNGEEIFTISDPAYRLEGRSQIAVGDIDNDGFAEILASASDLSILCFTHTGSLKWKSPVVSPTGAAVYGRGIAIADLNNDGQPEILLGSTVLNNNGTILWKGTGGIGTGYAGPLSLIADINLDGVPEIISGNTAYRNDGTILWQNKSLPDGLNAVGKFDINDPFPQIVLVRNGYVYLLNQFGQLEWGPKAIPSGGNGGPPVVADFDGDGNPEIGVAGYSRYVVFRGDGTILWQTTTHDYSSSATGSSVFDFEGDGKAEVLYNDEQYFRIYNGSDGRKLFETYNTSWTVYEYPIIADINNDGHAEIVVSANPNGTPGTYGIRVFGDADNSWVNTRQIWNQHTYHITNVNDDGSIPRIEQNNWDIYNNYRCNVLTKNNALATPDVTVSYLTVDNAIFPANVNLAVRIGNGGAVKLPAGVDISFYNGDPANGGTLIDTIQTTQTIEAGDYQDVAIVWKNPSAGTYNIYVIADPDMTLKECNTINNTAHTTLTVGIDVPPATNLPDLTLSPEDIVIAAPALTDGQSAVISATIHNIGTLGAANISVSFYDGDPQNGGTLINAASIPGIAAGATAIAAVTWNTYGQSGRNYIHIVIDPLNLIIESNKNNNASLTAIDIAVPTKPDPAVTASDITLSNANPKAGELLSVNAVIHNLGIAVNPVEVSLYDGDPAAGGTLLAQKTISSNIPSGGFIKLSFEINTLGLSGSHKYYVIADPDNKIDEVNENNNIAGTSATILSANLNMTLATDKTVYDADEGVQITTTISNLMAASRTESLDIMITDAFGNQVDAALTGQQITLAANGNETVHTSWNTGDTFTGTYKAVALLHETNVVVARAETIFTIAGSASVTANVSADKLSYNANEAVLLTSTVQSTAANMILTNLTACVSVADSSGTVLFTYHPAVPILTPGQLTQLKSYWNTVTHPQGTYNVSLNVFDGTTLLSTAVSAFSIAGSSLSVRNLKGTIQATPVSVYQGQSISAGYTVTNNGNEDISSLRIKILIVDPVTADVKTELSDQQPVAQGASIIGVGLNNISTTGYAPGTYLAILQAATPAMTEFATLAKTNFEVKTGLDITKKIKDVINLLVWVNKFCRKSENKGKQSPSCDNDDKDCIRIDLLKKILNHAGVNYLLVYDKKDFQRQMRNPYFTDYMILGDDHPLEDHFDDELQELVYYGKGLLSSLFVQHDKKSTPFTGIYFKGHLSSKYHRLYLTSSPIAAESALDIKGKSANTELAEDATVAGWLLPDEQHHVQMDNRQSRQCLRNDDMPGIVLNDYGQGRSVFFAFDLGATLDDGNYEQMASLIKNSILYAHKPLIGDASFLPNQLVPVEVKIASLGGIFDLKIKETYPPNVRLYDPSTRKWITDNPWQQDTSLASGALYRFLYYVLTPDAAGSYPLETEIGFVQNETVQLYKKLGLQLTVGCDQATLADGIIAALIALPAERKDVNKIRKAIKYIEHVNDRVDDSQRACEENIRHILNAIEEIMEVNGCDTTQVRLMMDMLLQIYQGKYYFR